MEVKEFREYPSYGVGRGGFLKNLHPPRVSTQKYPPPRGYASILTRYVTD